MLKIKGFKRFVSFVFVLASRLYWFLFDRSSERAQLRFTLRIELPRSSFTWTDSQWHFAGSNVLSVPRRLNARNNAININVESLIVARTKKNIGQSESFIGTRTWSGIGTIVHKVTWPWRQEKAGFPTLARSKRGDIHRRSFGMLRCFTASLFLFFSPLFSFFVLMFHSRWSHPRVVTRTRCTSLKSHFSGLNNRVKLYFERMLQLSHGCFYYILKTSKNRYRTVSSISSNFHDSWISIVSLSIFELCREELINRFRKRRGMVRSSKLVRDNSVHLLSVPIYFPVDRTWSRARETLKKMRIRENKIPRIDPDIGVWHIASSSISAQLRVRT